MSRSIPTHVNHVLLATLATVSLLAGAPRFAAAQPELNPARWEFLMSSGAVVPTGPQRDAISSGALSTAQLTWVARPALAVTGTFGWARSHDKSFAGEPALDLFSYDMGGEARAPFRPVGKAVTFRPIVGAGVGARSYNHRHLDLAVSHDLAAYGGVGADVGVGPVQVRLEARDYVLGFKALDGRGPSDTRSELAFMAGLRLVSR